MITVLLFLVTVVSVAQNSISGTVVDNNNESIVGVNVIIQGTDKGVQTDMNGKFEIKNVPSGNFKLVISFIGFKTKVIDATASNNLGISWSSTTGGTFTGGSTLTPTYTPSAADILAGSVTLTLTATGNTPCGDETSTMILTIDPLPTPGPIWHN